MLYCGTFACFMWFVRYILRSGGETKRITEGAIVTITQEGTDLPLKRLAGQCWSMVVNGQNHQGAFRLDQPGCAVLTSPHLSQAGTARVADVQMAREVTVAEDMTASKQEITFRSRIAHVKWAAFVGPCLAIFGVIKNDKP